MDEAQDNAFMRFLNEKLVPFSTKVAQNKYIQAIGQGSMGLMAIILVGSIFNLLNTLPFEPYQAFLASSGLGPVFNAIYNAAMNFMGLFMVASVARGAAKSFGHEDLAIENMFLALMGYLILVPLVTNEAGDSLVNINYLGSRGAFMAFIVAIVTTKIHIFVVDRGFTIKMPAGVPESVGKTFTAIIPGLFCAIAFGIVRFVFGLTSYGNVIDAVYTVLQTPLAGLTGSLPGFIVIILVAQLLWFVGVHGSYTVLPIMFPIWFSYLGENMAAAAAGQPVPHLWNIAMYDFACNGGCGCTLGLVIVMALFAKSKRYKKFSKLVLPVGIFNINEPVVFGLPLMYNFTFIIPFMVTPILSLLLAYGCIQLGLMPAPTGIIGISSMPIVAYGIMQGSWKIGVYQIVATLMSAAIWFPFFKAADKQAVEEELAAEADQSALEGSE
ncbi:MAG: PTS transporter subunit EIIC [Coriobacteriales bacterium]|nr:PTS transporter subunit EIIC [Coriobacteriales bacterium]